MRFLSCQVSEDFGKLPKMFWRILNFYVYLGSTEKEHYLLLAFFHLKSVNLGLKCNLHTIRLFLSQIGSSLHFSVVNGSF